MRTIKSTTAWIIVSACVVVLFGGALTWYNIKYPTDDTASTSIIAPTTTVDATKDWKTYTNSTYGFSFKYPKEWEGTKTEVTSEPALGDLGKDLVLKVQFTDLTNKKQIDCANNEFQKWSSATPTEVECASVLSGLTAVQKSKLTGPKSPQNIYVRIWRKSDSATLKDWLYNKFHQPNTELEKYQVGEEIKMASLDGYYSSIGCCAQSDRNYVVEKNGYVYSLGTNYFENSITDTEMPATFLQIAGTVKIVDLTADWQTYTNADYGFSFKYPKDWVLKEYPDQTTVSVTKGADTFAINYYSSVTDEAENKSNNYGATTLAELVVKDPQITNETAVTFLGKDAYEVVWGGMAERYEILLLNNQNKFIAINFVNKAKKSDLTETQNTILSTFKLTS